ncbi:MAG: UDP-N-acetylmuramoyl-tripeptide--D-alanyl-D-alanine ligase [Rhodocyclaceae bacterium]|nr:UDP-N-acetylmuramoyl-tripeptide--D-alanyl-D-alanine ligase [Rhodocyclaceae bacterium]
MMSVAFAVAALAGNDVRLCGTPSDFDSVSTDSRNIKPGELFLALRGERFDGHAFVRDVLKAGAVAAVVDSAWAAENVTEGLSLFVVDDTRLAFGALAAAWRRTFRIPVIGVVGSNGKTTVKEMIASILAAEVGAEHRLATTGNLNNDIGVPTMLLRLNAMHQAAVIEMGMNHPGETAELAAMTEATVGIINNAQREHQEFMKTVAAVAEEHAALIAALPADGIAVLNADDEFFEYWKGVAGGRRIMSFGFGAAADVRFVSASAATQGTDVIRLATPQGDCEARLATVGAHNIRNALGAAAAALAAGCSLAGVMAGLEAFRPIKGRLQKHAAQGGSTVIDDSYNANPDSVRAAIDVLHSFSGPRVLVLGDMGEVGDAGEQYHTEIGAYARERGIDALLTLGEMTRATVTAFGVGATHFDSAEALLQALQPMLSEKTTVLVKGSRFMRMERIVEALRLPVQPEPHQNSSEGTHHAA